MKSAAWIIKRRSRGPAVFLMLKYVPSSPPRIPITPPAMAPIRPIDSALFIINAFQPARALRTC